MQFTTAVSVAFVAAIASANVHHPQHFHHRRHLANSTGPSTTLTVYATQIRTETKCPASITNCPAAGTGGAVIVTETKQVAVTVCPVEEAASISSAIASSYVASAMPSATASPTSAPSGDELTTTAPFTPIGTGTGSDSGSGSGSGSGEDTTLTYTLGTGTSTTVVTTTIKHTSTATLYATLPAGGAGGEGGETEEKTTTLSGTSTSTRYITVSAVPTGATSGESGSGSGGNSAAGTGAGDCASPVTVTVALSVSTVTVTATAVPTGVTSGEEGTTPNNAADAAPPANGSDSPSGGSEGAIPSDAVIIVSTATVVPVPEQTLQPTGPPYGNGTYPGQPGPSGSGAAHATTFITKPYSTSSATSAPAGIPTGYPTY